MGNNRISQGRTPNNIAFVNKNLSVLDKFTEQNGFVYFDKRRLGESLTLIQYNNQSSSSSNNISFSDITNIIFEGAILKQNPYNEKQVRVVIDPISLYLQDDKVYLQNDFYHLKQISSSLYNASVKQYLICNSDNPIQINLPQASDMDYIKIATLDKINQSNTVTIMVQNVGTYIHSTNEIMLVIDSPYSSVQLVFSESIHTWQVITPFIPMDRDTTGITKQQSIKNAKKQMLIFG